MPEVYPAIKSYKDLEINRYGFLKSKDGSDYVLITSKIEEKLECPGIHVKENPKIE